MVHYRENRGIWISHNSEKNLIRIRGERYYLDFLPNTKRAGKGAHSSVFVALDEVNRDPAFVLKFCKYPVLIEARSAIALNPYVQKIVDRFIGEQKALRIVADSAWASKAIKMLDSGAIVLPSSSQGNHESAFLWIALEVADSDLADFMKENPVELDQRVGICFDLLQSLIGLHSLGIVHRDIKPDNIVFVEGAWKFLDLGIASMTDRSLDLDDTGEKIGPFGYMSPEALNKCMGIRNHPGFTASCEIDELSDVFQLGMLYWYVFRGEVPAGIIDFEDMADLGLSSDIFELGIKRMLSLRKHRRPTCTRLMADLKAFFSEYGLSTAI